MAGAAPAGAPVPASFVGGRSLEPFPPDFGLPPLPPGRPPPRGRRFAALATSAGSRPNSSTSFGRRSPTRITASSSACDGCSGRPAGTTWLRTGENASASTAAAHRSWLTVGVSPSDTAAISRVASSGGRGVPAFGGRELRRSARTKRPASRFAVMSSIQLVCSCSTRRARPSWSCTSSARDSSSRVLPSAATTTERRSRRSSSSRSAIAASALSCHSAARSFGRSFSAMATS